MVPRNRADQPIQLRNATILVPLAAGGHGEVSSDLISSRGHLPGAKASQPLAQAKWVLNAVIRSWFQTRRCLDNPPWDFGQMAVTGDHEKSS